MKFHFESSRGLPLNALSNSASFILFYASNDEINLIDQTFGRMHSQKLYFVQLNVTS